MKTEVLRLECPFCLETSEVGTIENGGVTICLCGNCFKCWEVLNGSINRLIRYKDSAETQEADLLCPVCWRKLEPDFKSWVMRCLDPLCGYTRRLPGLSMGQEKIKREFKEIKTEIFKLMHENKPVSGNLQDRFLKLQAEYKKFRANDPNP